jgi:hypothetical protein
MGNALYDGPGYRYEAKGTVGSQVAGHYFSSATLQVRRFLSRVMSLRSVREFVEADPKTKKSRRSIILAPFALSALKQLLVRQVEAKVKAGHAWQEHDYVFCTLTGTHLRPITSTMSSRKS